MSEPLLDPAQAEILNTLRQLLLVSQQILNQQTQQLELLTVLATGLTPFQGGQS